MGDRANIVVVQHPGREANGLIYLYTHWGGYAVPETLQRALRKQWRWNDETYLTRIIFEEMLGDERGTETGFGISTYLTDHEYPLLVIDCADKRVWTAAVDKPLTHTNSWSFAEYVALDFGDREFGGWHVLAPERFS